MEILADLKELSVFHFLSSVSCDSLCFPPSSLCSCHSVHQPTLLKCRYFFKAWRKCYHSHQRVQRWAVRRSRVQNHTCLRKGKGVSLGEWMTQRVLGSHLGRRSMGKRACRMNCKKLIQKNHGRKSLSRLESQGIPLLIQGMRQMRNPLYVPSVAKPSIIPPT